MPEFDPTKPSIARVYDYVLGGKDNYAADRDVADRLLAIVPLIGEMAVENRQFLSRAATWAAKSGISQFADLGCGLPTVPNTHESVLGINPAARVAYVDNDPVVIRHLQALFAQGNPGVRVTDADAGDAATVIDALRESLDLSRPVCLIIGYLLHFYTAGAARDLVSRYAAALAPGSCVVLSVLHYDGDAADEGMRTYSSEVASMYMHTPADIASFFGPFELVPPGITDTRQWHPDGESGGEAGPLPPRAGFVYAGVARKPLPAAGLAAPGRALGAGAPGWALRGGRAARDGDTPARDPGVAPRPGPAAREGDKSGKLRNSALPSGFASA
jgi:SAM-dependent methyltransferase